VRGNEITMPKHNRVQPYLLERKGAKKWYVRLFKRLLNAAVHNAFVMYNTKSKTLHLTYQLDLVKSLILTHMPQIPSPAGPRQPSVNPPPGRLTGISLSKFLPLAKKAKPQRKCAFCTVQKKIRKETIFWCPDCQVRLCFIYCFKEYHTQVNL
jgi:hypothetical protein